MERNIGQGNVVVGLEAFGPPLLLGPRLPPVGTAEFGVGVDLFKGPEPFAASGGKFCISFYF